MSSDPLLLGKIVTFWRSGSNGRSVAGEGFRVGFVRRVRKRRGGEVGTVIVQELDVSRLEAATRSARYRGRRNTVEIDRVRDVIDRGRAVPLRAWLDRRSS